MRQMKEISFKDRDAIFDRLERIASQANLSKEERAQYDYEWKVANDYFNTLETAKNEGLREGLEEGREIGLEEGRKEGRKEEKLAIAKKMKEDGLSWEMIAKFTGLTMEETSQLHIGLE